MLKKEYSLKTRYNFSKTLKYGKSYDGNLFIVKYLAVNKQILESESVKFKFGVITSNRLTKKKVTQNKLRRSIFRVIKDNLDFFIPNYYYVFIPKKRMLNITDNKVLDLEVLNDIKSFLDI